MPASGRRGTARAGGPPRTTEGRRERRRAPRPGLTAFIVHCTIACHGFVKRRLKGVNVMWIQGHSNEQLALTRRARRLRAEALAALARRVGGRLCRSARLALAALQRERERRGARAALHALDDRLLADIGLDRGTIDAAVDGLVTRRVPAAAPVPLSARVTRAGGDSAAANAPAAEKIAGSAA